MPELIIPDEVSELMSRPSLKIVAMNIDEYIKENNLPYVTSPNIFEPNSNKFHPTGLFSEELFGPVTDMRRFTTEAAIALNTTIIHPIIFSMVIEPKDLLTGIMSGKKYGAFDEETHTFKLSDAESKGAGTGFSFFLRYVDKLTKAAEPDSLRAKNIHKLFLKYQDILLIKEIICLPAGLRDLDLKSPRLSKDDINKIYLNILNLTAGLSRHSLSEDPIFDGIRYQIQAKVAELYHYLEDIMGGKGGFMQKHYGARRIAYSTRNVISVPVMDADTPDDPTILKADETMIPILNLVKDFQPFFVNYVKNRLYGEIFMHGATEHIPVTNPNTFGIEYINVSSAEKNKYNTVDGVTRVLNRFKHVGFRESPVSISNIMHKDYWLLLTYKHEDIVFIGKSVDDLKELVTGHNLTYDNSVVQPMRWVEALYLAGVEIATGKHCLITRYPVLGDGSIYPSKIHPISTNPSKSVTVMFGGGSQIEVPHYPIIGSTYYESAIIHPSKLAGLDADFDGDMISLPAVWTDEGNAEIAAHLDSISNVIGSNFKLKARADQDIIRLVIHNLSRQMS